jgi:hypothetical protein
VKSLLARPPQLSLATSFAEAYDASRFTQLELITESDLISEARKHDLTLRRETLEELDRHGVFRPIAFASGDYHGRAYGPRWNIDALTFRDGVDYHRWGRYSFREDSVRRVLAL